MDHSKLIRTIPWVYRILFVSFFLPLKWQTWILLSFSTAVVIVSVLLYVKPKKKEWLTALLLGSAYLLYIVWIPLTPAETSAELYSLAERKVSYLLLPFIFLLFSHVSHISWRPYLGWFVSGAVVTSLATNAIILWEVNLQPAAHAMNHVAYRTAFERIAHIHPTYFGMYLCFAIAILWLHGGQYVGKRLWISVTLQLFLFISLILLMPKSAVLALAVLFVYAFLKVFQIGKLQKLWLALALIVGLSTLYVVFPIVQQRMDEVLFFANGHAPDVRNNSMDMRHVIFKEDMVLLKKHWLLGLGPSGLQEQLNLLFFVSSFYAGHALGTFNTHNEYLNQWLSFGVFGMLLFLLILFLHVRKAIHHHHTLYLFLLIILMVTFLTENALSRQHGVVFYSLFTSLFFFVREKEG